MSLNPEIAPVSMTTVAATNREQPASSTQARQWGPRVGVALVVILAVAWMIAIATHGVEAGSTAGRVHFPWVKSVRWWGLLTTFLGAALLILAGRIALQVRPWLGVLVVYALALPSQLLLRAAVKPSLGAIVRSDRANSFYSPTLRYSASEFFGRFAHIAPSLPLHARTNMPGKEGLYYLLELLTHAPTGLAIAIILVANLGAVGAYLAIVEMSHQHEAGIRGMQLWVLTPGLIALIPILNIVSGVPVVFIVWQVARFLNRPRWSIGIGVGVLVFISLVFEPLPLTAGLVCLGMLVHGVLSHRIRFGAMLGISLVTAASTAVSMVLWRVVTGDWVPSDLRYVFGDASAFNTRARRPYSLWVGANLKDFVWCAGVTAIVLALCGLVAAARRRVPALVGWLSGGILATLLAIDLIGIDRGETQRLWIFLASLLALPAGWYLGARSTSRRSSDLCVLMAALQAGLQVMVVLWVGP